MRFHRAFGIPNQCRSRRVRFQTTLAPARALLATRYDNRMTQLRTRRFISFQQLTFGNNTAADTRTERQKHYVFLALRRAEFRFAERRNVGVVGNLHLQARQIRNRFTDTEILPLQVIRINNVPRFAIDHTGHAHAKPFHIVRL